MDPGSVQTRLCAVSLRLDAQGRVGLGLQWRREAGGLCVAWIDSDPGQPDIKVGDRLVTVGGCKFSAFETRDEAIQALEAECATALDERALAATVARRCGPEDAREHAKITDVAAVEGPHSTSTEGAPAAPAAASPAAGARRDRLYRYWPGANRFCCFGFAMTGHPGHGLTSAGCLRDCRSCLVGETRWKDCCESSIDFVEYSAALNRPLCTAASPANCFAWVCILAPSALYFAAALPYFWAKVHPILPLVAVFFFVLTAGCLSAACCSDPGIIPRREVILATGAAERLRRELGYDVLGEPEEALAVRGGTLQAMVPIELRSQGYRWCSTCRIVRPPRASHCPDCDNCVLRFDHHCPFVNNCVGQRNYLFFIGFTTSVCCLAVTVIPMLLWYLVVGLVINKQDAKPVGFHEVDAGGVVQGVLITLAVAGGGGALFVCALWLYHVFLIFSGLTTKEHWRGRRVRVTFPGLGEDLTIFGRRGPRLFDPRASVEVEPASIQLEGRTHWRLKGSDEENPRFTE